jgi:uncharacterized protein YabE (DUF348 family)
MQNFTNILKRNQQAHIQRFKRWHEHPFVLPIGVFIVLVVVGVFAMFLYSSRTHTTFHPNTSYIAIISHDHETQTVPTKEPTVGGLLTKLNIHLGKGDRVEPSANTAIEQDNIRINIYRALPITIYDGTTTTTTFSAAATARSVVAEAGMPLYGEDIVRAAPAENLITQQSLGERITIERSVPVTLNVYGTLLSLHTHARTVADLLRNKHVVVGKADTVIPDQSTAITPNMQVFVNRKGTQIVTVTEQIPAPVQTITDSSLSFGTSAVRQQGSPGMQILTYQVNTQNGVEVGRTLLQTVVTVQPVTQVVAQGLAVSVPADKAGVMAEAGISSSDYQYVDYIMSHESGWCPTKWQGQHDCPAYYVPLHSEDSGFGYGIGQATPGSKMAGFGADWRTNVVTQLKWANSYAIRSKGSWAGAYNYWVAHHNW